MHKSTFFANFWRDSRAVFASSGRLFFLNGGMQAYSASLRGKFASQTLPPPYNVKRRIARSRKIERTTLRAIHYFASLHGTLASQVCDRPYKRNSSKHRRGDPWSPVKNQRREQTKWRRTDTHTHCRDRASGQQVASLSVIY